MEHNEHLKNISIRCNILIEDIVKQDPYVESFYGCNIMSDFDNFVLFNKPEDIRKKIPTDPSLKELRLALDMINQRYPLYKRSDNKTKLGFLYDIFDFDIIEKDLDKLKSFKKITKKARIVLINNKPKLISVIRYRNPKLKIYL